MSTMIERKTLIDFCATKEPSIAYLIGILEDARATTLQRVEGIATHELHWQFAEGWNTIGVLLAHIYCCAHVFRIEFIEQRKLTTEEDAKWIPGCELGKYVPQLITNEQIERYVTELEESKMQLFEKIKGLDKTAFYERREGYNPKNGYNLAWVLYHLAEDEVHHRGQISILRKLYNLRAGK